MKKMKKLATCGVAALMAVNAIVIAGPSIVASAAEDAGSSDWDDGLIAYYSFDNTLDNAVGTGSAALHGGAGDTWNAAVTGTAAYAEGVNGQAYSFTGDTVSGKGEGLELDVKMPAAYTISYWVNPKTVNSATSMVFSPIDLDNGLNIADNWFGNTFPTVRIWGSSAAIEDCYLDNWITSGDDLCGQWTYVTLTHNTNGSTVLYINGIQAAVGRSKAGAFEGKDIFLGINYWDASFDGLMDDVAIYDRALSAEQVALLYLNDGVPNDSGAYTPEDVVLPQHVTVHDPSIIEDNGTYYIFGSHMAWAKSDDLIHWEYFTNNINRDYATLFAEGAQWASHGSRDYDVSGNLWAPDVIWNEDMGKWCMYMSVNGSGWYSSIALLTADSLDGDWEYKGTVVYSGFANSLEAAETDFAKVTGSDNVPARYLENRNGNRTYGMNAIDPCVLYDENGDLWMSYGSWFGGIYMLKLDKETGLRDYACNYETVANESDEYQGIKIAGGDHSSGEASYIQKIGDYYYLFMSYGGLEANKGYNMRVFRSESITGPYVDSSGDAAKWATYVNNINGTIGNRLMSSYQWSYMDTGFVAQGHNSAFMDIDGRAYVVYHTRFNGGDETHEVRVHQLFENEDGWLVAAPFEYMGESLTSDVTAEDVAGDYEVLFHKLNIDYENLEVVRGENITFSADGKITGDYTGTWEFGKEGAPYVTLKIGGTAYKGVFVYQRMENSLDSTWAFTVLGDDEISIWGYNKAFSHGSSVAPGANPTPGDTTGTGSTEGTDGTGDVSTGSGNDGTGSAGGSADGTSGNIPESPKTADSDLFVWILLCGVVGCGLAGAAMADHRKKKNVR